MTSLALPSSSMCWPVTLARLLYWPTTPSVDTVPKYSNDCPVGNCPMACVAMAPSLEVNCTFCSVTFPVLITTYLKYVVAFTTAIGPGALLASSQVTLSKLTYSLTDIPVACGAEGLN